MQVLISYDCSIREFGCSIREYRSIFSYFLFSKNSHLSATYAKQLEYSYVYSVLLLFTEYFVALKTAFKLLASNQLKSAKAMALPALPPPTALLPYIAYSQMINMYLYYIKIIPSLVVMP